METRKARLQNVSPLTGASLTFLGLGGLVGSVDLAASRLGAFLGLSAKVTIEAVAPILLGAWHVFQPFVIGHARPLEGLLQVSLSCWRLVLALVGMV